MLWGTPVPNCRSLAAFGEGSDHFAMNKLISLVANVDFLYQAWRSVRSLVRQTSWTFLLEELAQIDAAPLNILGNISFQLKTGSYEFSPKLAYAKRKSGGSRRGITVQRLCDRIVQRAILNVMYSTDQGVQSELGELPEILRTLTSFAGAPGRGVPDAIRMAEATIRAGAGAFAYSDMKDFFPCIPRHDVIALLESNISDRAFVQLFGQALETEIANPSDVEAWISLFPIREVGVAQGSLLSTLVGNLCLRQFDVEMNKRDLVTIRYLDDFLILTNDLATAEAGFSRAQAELAQLKMSCYAPGDGSHKASMGRVADGIQFLGCQIHPDGISPARVASRKLLKDIESIISEAKRNIMTYTDSRQRRRTESTYIQALSKIDRKIRGWGDVYKFVSNRLPFTQLDGEISRKLEEFRSWLYCRLVQGDDRSRRRMLGVSLLSDTSPDE